MEWLVDLVLVLAIGAGLWKAFEKMGREGWEGIIPIYNYWVLTKLLQKEDWYLILFIIPIVNILPMMEVAKRFGRPDWFGIGLAFGVFWPVVGFDESQWSDSPIS